MLWRTLLSLVGGEDIITEPPDQVLDLAVVGEYAHLTIRRVPESGELLYDEPVAGPFTLPARSLLRALQAAMEEDDDGELHRLNAEANRHFSARMASAFARPLPLDRDDVQRQVRESDAARDEARQDDGPPTDV